MTRALVLCLLLSACSPATTVERKEQVVQGALDGAFVACTAALGDPRVTWAKGAREYCELIVNGGCGAP